jgi:hypothetical protein
MSSVSLIHADGSVEPFEVSPPPVFARPAGPIGVRQAYAAAHVIPGQAADNVPGADADIDWETTLAFRHHLWSWGLGVADAMDTAQRNMGLGPAAVTELVRRSAAEARAVAGPLVVGVSTDHLEDPPGSLDDIVRAYLEQLEEAEDNGAGVVLMASRHLVHAASSAADYAYVYGEVLRRAGAPVILHWLGEVFDPALHGYFGSADAHVAAAGLLEIITANTDRVRGVKVSLLDTSVEVALRAALPDPVRLFTGDDHNYVELIEGDGQRSSDALLGAFAAIAPAASAALQRLAAGDLPGYRSILTPTQDLARQVFAAPTYYYKVGIAFLAWLNGHQPAFSMVGGLHAARSLPHLSEVIRRASTAGALEDPDLAAHRWQGLLAVHGYETRREVIVR